VISKQYGFFHIKNEGAKRWTANHSTTAASNAVSYYLSPGTAKEWHSWSGPGGMEWGFLGGLVPGVWFGNAIVGTLFWVVHGVF
jgi:hypothetical protein